MAEERKRAAVAHQTLAEQIEMSPILPPAPSSPLNLCLHPELAHGGYSCIEPPLQVLPFWLQRAISCTKRRPGWEGAGAQVGLAVLALSLPLGSILPRFRAAFLSVSSLAS